jgi:hypothetical protein
MKPYDFESMSTDELWALHEKIMATLAKQIAVEKRASRGVFASLYRYQAPMAEA